MTGTNYESLGRFIYGSCRYGGGLAEVVNWMADDLGVARLDPGDDLAVAGLFSTFLAKYADADEIAENYARFMESLKEALMNTPTSSNSGVSLHEGPAVGVRKIVLSHSSDHARSSPLLFTLATGHSCSLASSAVETVALQGVKMS
jgi:hypothetical protein